MKLLKKLALIGLGCYAGHKMYNWWFGYNKSNKMTAKDHLRELMGKYKKPLTDEEIKSMTEKYWFAKDDKDSSEKAVLIKGDLHIPEKRVWDVEASDTTIDSDENFFAECERCDEMSEQDTYYIAK